MCINPTKNAELVMAVIKRGSCRIYVAAMKSISPFFMKIALRQGATLYGTFGGGNITECSYRGV